MPDYLVFDTSLSRKLTEAPVRRVNDAATPAEAVAVVLLGTGFQADQSFTVFRVNNATKINVEQSRSIKELDPADPTGNTVLASYDEAALEALRAARAAL
jgi:hypothetical protein